MIRDVKTFKSLMNKLICPTRKESFINFVKITITSKEPNYDKIAKTLKGRIYLLSLIKYYLDPHNIRRSDFYPMSNSLKNYYNKQLQFDTHDKGIKEELQKLKVI